MLPMKLFHPRRFSLSGLRGISNDTLQMHLQMYEAHVAETNKLTEQLHRFAQGHNMFGKKTLTFKELTRRLSSEYDAMVLHEHYFANLKRDGGEPDPDSVFAAAVIGQFGSYEAWKRDFISTGLMPDVGWVICYQDLLNRRLLNYGITGQHVRNLVGHTPILVMDVWDHAFLLDYPLTQRLQYITAFFANIDWNVVDQRLIAAVSWRQKTDLTQFEQSTLMPEGATHGHH
jgi:superoxide dismutase, Fe-Mn family